MPVNNPPPAGGASGITIDANGYTTGISGLPPIRVTIEDDGVQVTTTFATWDTTAGKERVIASIVESS